jgi:hypothetical protein
MRPGGGLVRPVFSLLGFEHRQAAVEVTGFDGLHKGRDHPGERNSQDLWIGVSCDLLITTL